MLFRIQIVQFGITKEVALNNQALKLIIKPFSQPKNTVMITLKQPDPLTT